MVIKIRDINRIPVFLKELEECWMKVPDWRFGQLIVNFVNYLGIDPFSMEEDKMTEKLHEFFDGINYK